MKKQNKEMTMKRILFFFFIVMLSMPVCLVGQDLKSMELLPPDTVGGKPLMEVLKNRKTSRAFGVEKLPKPVLSNLLWAAFGINRPDGHRTAPSAMNWQEIDIYAVMEEGAYLYDAKNNALIPVVKEDLREKTGTQPFVKDAPLNLVYVADISKTKRASGDDQALYTGADAGFIAQNVYLFCASEGLSTVIRGSVDRPALAKSLMLRQDQKIILAQTVGYPAK
jgi:SagB-type dehydrogenase family enzyme